jgi:hypothetical protein
MRVFGGLTWARYRGLRSTPFAMCGDDSVWDYLVCFVLYFFGFDFDFDFFFGFLVCFLFPAIGISLSVDHAESVGAGAKRVWRLCGL